MSESSRNQAWPRSSLLLKITVLRSAKYPGPRSNRQVSSRVALYTIGSNRISHFASEEALLAACNVHERGVTIRVMDNFLLGGNVAQTGRDWRLETTFLASLVKNYVGSVLIPF